MKNLTGALLVLSATLAWSTAGLFTRVVTTDIPTTLFWRSLTGGICVLAIYYFLAKRPSLREMFRFSAGEFWIASLSTAGMLCFISSFFFTTIANVAFVYGIMPLITYFLALLFLKERISLFPVLCCFGATLGMVIMTAGNTELNDYTGIALALAMAFFMAALTVAIKFFPDADAGKTVYLSGFQGALVMLPFATHFPFHPVDDYLWLILCGITNVGLGFGLYCIGVKRVSALAAALITLGEIPLAPIWAWLLFAEYVNGTVLLGGVLITLAAVTYTIGTHYRKKEGGGK